jgi:3-oxoadipate enol-lactonase
MAVMLSGMPENRMRIQVEVPGGRLRVVDEGDGPPVVLVHAGIAQLESWDGFVPLLVDAGYRVVRYDARGWGESTADDVAFSERADLIAVLDATGIGRAALVGNSRGGSNAFDTAIEYPDRIVAVVGVGAGLGGFDGDVTPEEGTLFTEMDRLESLDPPDPAAVAEIDVRVWVDGPGQPATRVPAWIREAIRGWDAPLYAEGHVFGERLRLDPPAAARLDDLRVPVLAIAGALDVSEVAQTAHHLEAHAPMARALVWPDVAHMVGMEAPERLAAAIVGFLEPLPRWR